MAATATDYPAPRLNRYVPATTKPGTVADVQLPTPRIIPILFNGGNAHTSVLVLGPFVGPGVIEEFWGALTGNTGGNTPSVAMYVAGDNSGGGIDLAQGFVPPGTRINDLAQISESSASSHIDSIGWPMRANEATTERTRYPIHYPVSLDPWYLKIRISAPAAITGNMYGYLKLFERVPPNLLINFL